MERRDALRLLATSVAGSALLRWEPEALIAAIRPHLDHTPRAGAASDYRFQVLDAHQQKTIAELCDMIIPATGTPGAKAVKVDEFIDVILAEWCSDADRAAFLKRSLGSRRGIDAGERSRVRGVRPRSRARRCSTILDSELTAARAARKAWKRGAGPPPPDHSQDVLAPDALAHRHRLLHERDRVHRGAAGGADPGHYKACMPVEHR